MSHTGMWNIAKKGVLEGKDAPPKEEGDLIRECMAMHEVNFLCILLRDDMEGGGNEQGG